MIRALFPVAAAAFLASACTSPALAESAVATPAQWRSSLKALGKTSVAKLAITAPAAKQRIAAS